MGTEHGCGAATSASNGQRFYRFQDASGRVHLVDSIDSVPQASRANAQCLAFSEDSHFSAARVSHSLQGLSGLQGVGLGAAGALAVVFVFWRLPGVSRMLMRLAIVGGIAGLVAGVYFGWLRHATQQSGDLLAGPGALMDDARNAVSKMNARQQAEQDALKETEQVK
jgi:hypothetical protein